MEVGQHGAETVIWAPRSSAGTKGTDSASAGKAQQNDGEKACSLSVSRKRLPNQKAEQSSCEEVIGLKL